MYLIIESRIRINNQVFSCDKRDKDLQDMTRKELCRYMDRGLPRKGFYEIQSTSKIRIGCQLVRKYNKLRENHNRLTRKVRNDAKRNSN